MALSQQVTNLVWGRSGGRCYLDRTEQVSRTPSGNLPLGEIAHIVSERKNGPRGREKLPAEQRNKADNLILVCPNHHVEIDKHPDVWTVERLKRVKEQHEQWVHETLDATVTPSSRFANRTSDAIIDLESAALSRGDRPRFSFSIKNVGSTSLVIHSIDANILALGVKPSMRHREHMLANMMFIMRTGVTFDFSEVGKDRHIPASRGKPLSGLLRKLMGFDPLEVALSLDPGETHSFKAIVKTGDFATGTFRLVARYWIRPDMHLRSISPSVAFFSVPDRWSRWSAKERDSEAQILGFDELVSEAAKGTMVERSIWTEDTFDRAQLFQRTLGQFEQSESREVIERWLSTDVPALCAAALEAIDSSPNSEWKAVMTERALSHPLEAVRANAVSIIGDLEYTNAFDALAIRAFCDSSAIVRRRTLERLRYKSNPAIERAKARLRADPDPEVKKLANELAKHS